MATAIEHVVKPVRHPPGSNAYWGPRIWRMLHLYAAISDRNDLVMIWRSLMRITGTVMPCKQCRLHFAEYFKTHSILAGAKLPRTPGNTVKIRIQLDLWTFHNSVNIRLLKPLFEFADLEATYKSRSRDAILVEARGLFTELVNAWTPLIHTYIHPGILTLWKKQVNLLHAFLKSGPLL